MSSFLFVDRCSFSFSPSGGATNKIKVKFFPVEYNKWTLDITLQSLPSGLEVCVLTLQKIEPNVFTLNSVKNQANTGRK